MSSFNARRPSWIQTRLARILVADDPAHLESVSRGELDLLAEQARRSNLEGFFLQACRRLHLQLNSELQGVLTSDATRTAAINFNGLTAFKPLAETLNRAGMPFMLLKGAVLNLTLYDRPDVRLMTDIDILIHAHDAACVDDLLLNHGCLPGRDLVREDFYPTFYYEKEYILPVNTLFRVDVHVRPFRPLRFVQTLPERALWEDTRTTELDGVAVTLPSDENMLLHLAAHSAIHGDARLLWLHDIFQYLHARHQSIDRDAFCRKVAQWRLTLPVRRTLERVSELFGDPLCDDWAARLDAPVSWRDRLLLRQCPHDADRPLRHILTNLLTTPGLRFKFGYLRAVCLPDRVHMAERYRLRHPGWLLCAHLRRVCRAGLRPLDVLRNAARR